MEPKDAESAGVVPVTFPDQGQRRTALLWRCGASSWDRRDVFRHASGVVSYSLVPHRPMDGG